MSLLQPCTITCVEYNARKVYLGLWVTPMSLTYCQQPIGRIGEDGFILNAKPGSTTIHTHHTYEVDIDYVIAKFEGKVTQGGEIDIPDNLVSKMNDYCKQ